MMTKAQRRRLAALSKATRWLDKEHQPEIKIEEGDDERPPEDPSQFSRASHHSG
jgi:hypothetical protein